MKTPKVFHPSAQGCRIREATLGHAPPKFSNPERVASCVPRFDATPLGLMEPLDCAPRVARASQPWAERRYSVGVNSRRAPCQDRSYVARRVVRAGSRSKRRADHHRHAFHHAGRRGPRGRRYIGEDHPLLITSLQANQALNLKRALQPQRTQRTQRKTITWEDRQDHLSGENPLSLKFPALRSLRSLRLINCRI